MRFVWGLRKVDFEMRAETRTKPEPMLRLIDCDVTLRGTGALRKINWTLDQGRNWAILGGNGAGKSTLLRLIRGDLWPNPGSGRREYFHAGRVRQSPLGFREKTRLISLEALDLYRKNEWRLDCGQVVCTGFADTPLLYHRPGPEELAAAREALNEVGLAELTSRPITDLSQGQAKRVLIARALVRRPELLILDEIGEGLDAAARKKVLAAVEKVSEAGVQLLFATHRPEEIPSTITDALFLEKGRVALQGPCGSPEIRRRLNGPASTPARPVRPRPGGRVTGNRRLIEISRTDVWLADRHVLHDLDWTIRSGEQWALLGGNGAGKSTLLRLLGGDQRPALGGRIIRFEDPQFRGQTRIRRRISLVSAHSQAEHRAGQSVRQTVLSGFSGSVGMWRAVTSAEEKAAARWLDFFGLNDLAERDIATLSYGQTRRVLIARAMVTSPEILLLDEPLGGLDRPTREYVSDLLEQLIEQGVCLVYATHYPEDLPPGITHLAILKDGRLTCQAARSGSDQVRIAASA